MTDRDKRGRTGPLTGVNGHLVTLTVTGKIVTITSLFKTHGPELECITVHQPLKQLRAQIPYP